MWVCYLRGGILKYGNKVIFTITLAYQGDQVIKQEQVGIIILTGIGEFGVWII